MREFEEIINNIKGNRLNIKAKKIAGNFEQIRDIFKRGPTIIHISCHGYFINQKVNIGVEKKKKLGVKAHLDQEKIQMIANDRFTSKFLNHSQKADEPDRGTKILFVSACHSENIADQLAKSFNIPISIYIDNRFQVADLAGIEFASSFYNNLFIGDSVESAFDNAKDSVDYIMRKINVCCCYHSHVAGCKNS